MNRFLALLRKIIPKPIADTVRPGYHFSLAALGNLIYRFPGRRLHVIGVTGTNGKSTTAKMVASVLEAGGYTIGLATTINFQVGRKKWINQSKMTTRGRFATYRLLRQMVRAGCSHAVLEVTSQALVQNRVWGVPFQTAVLTNLTREHLDLHGSMEAYQAAKGKLFTALASSGHEQTFAVVNGDDEHAEYFLNFPATHHYVFSMAARSPKLAKAAHVVRGTQTKSTAAGSTATAVTNGQKIPLMIHLPGRFNIGNALAAVSVGLAYGVKPEHISQGIAAVKNVPGRMERVDAGQSFNIIIDFTVTPDAYEKALSTLRELTEGKLIAVFGSAGNRDKPRRPMIGNIAAKYCDTVFLTEDDPETEKVEDIISQIAQGLEAGGKHKGDYWIVPSRREAINKALSIAGPKDTVALLGKGHETLMSYGDRKEPWNEHQVAIEEWQKLSSSQPG